MSDNGSRLRSARWFGGHDLAGFIHRASIHAEGISRHALAGRPVIGVCNSWSELVNCNLHFRSLAESVKRGVLQAGGLPLEFPTISLGENLMKPTTMLFRNLMAMDVEECIRAYPLDAVVLLGGCDKTVPAQLMGAASADVPAIMLTGGPSEPAWFRGQPLGAGTDLWHYVDELRAGRMSREEFDQLEEATHASYGHCHEMGTASTLTSIVEALGMCLPATASIPAVDAARHRAAEATGRRAVELAREGPRPSQILTVEAFDNAITLLQAIGGSTNAVIHLLALAGRVGVALSLERFDQISRRTPVLANVRPSGEYLVEHLHRAGGVPALLKQLEPLLHGGALTVTGRTLAEGFAHAEVLDRSVIAAFDTPLAHEGGIAVLRGSLAPDGAVIKRSAASPSLLRHRGPAVVFEDVYDVAARIDDPSLDVGPDSVLVLRNSGPKGGPGMPEWGQLPIPSKLLRRGVTDLVRVSDARMSGTSFGTVVLHVAPESAAGGPLGAVEDGDPIVLDIDERRLDLDVPAEEVQRRLQRLGPPEPRYLRGYGALYLDHVLQASEGCDFDFLRALPDQPVETEPLGLLSGWVGGW
jgi:dihydroxy-acid dehydratase